MKKILLLATFIVSILTVSACSLKLQSKNSPTPQQTNAPKSSEPSQSNNASQPASEPSKVSEPTSTVQPAQFIANISNDLFNQNMEAVDSYRRKLRTVSTCEGQTSEKTEEFAYIKKPFSSYTLLNFITSGSYSEEIIADDTLWGRMNKNDKWDKASPGQWFSDPPRTFNYTLSMQMYPINYEKLTLQQVGSEQMNGVNCIKYAVSGTYQDEFSFKVSPQIYPITLSATGNIWIADDSAIKQVVVSQRITVKTDIVDTVIKDKQGNPLHIITEDAIEDDILDINSTVIQPPLDSETNTLGGTTN